MPALDPAEGKDHLEIQSESRTERRYQRADASGWTDDLEALGEKVKGYVKQSAVWVGRNSSFHLDDLADEELKEVGGVEFGAIRVLSWLVPCVRARWFEGKPVDSRLHSILLARISFVSSSGRRTFPVCIGTTLSLPRNLVLLPWHGASVGVMRFYGILIRLIGTPLSKQ